ncbi:hypothetical protein [Variovorax sp. LG9.2]|jgi:hypothetical protein|uniref:DUF7673 family protein n=1 Tax=Variovorax sp. LG9.2 TaxID=3048626 RepID=UPI002B234583|nr:hypothetical protein [Variovorax sp. LG9.2]MEB0060362.1 hypothetical protein [Variovorax sp. LG9.2]
MSLEEQFDSYRQRASAAQGPASQAFARLLDLAEHQNSGQIRTVVLFLASTYNGQAFPFDPFNLRSIDVDISDDMLLCLDALRWGKADLYKLVPDGDRRVKDVIKDWGLKWPEND